MDFNIGNTIIIIGKSEFLNSPDIYTKIPELQKKYHNIGINQAALVFRTEYFAFSDNSQKHYLNLLHPDTKLITGVRNVTTFEGDYVLTDRIFDLSKYTDIYAYHGFTHDVCISWAYLHNYRNVILVGVADFTNSSNYTDFVQGTPLVKPSFTYDEPCKEASIKFIENAQKYLDIYTLNPSSVLNIPRIIIKELLD